MAEANRGGDLDLAANDGLHRRDEAQYSALFALLHPKLLHLARRVVGRADLAEEVAQDTWIAVLKGLPGFRGTSRLTTWIVAILLRRASNCAAREHRTIAEAPNWATGLAVTRDVQEDLLDKERRRHLTQAIDRLPTAQSRLVSLRLVENLDAVEAAARLGISPGNQRILLHRARKRLVRILGDNEG